jgi:hypothetical protein
VDDSAAEAMLSEGQVREMEAWLRSARLWSETSQAMVGAATGLTNASRSLAGQFEPPSASLFSDEGDQGAQLATQLRLLAETIEDEGRELRDRYLTTEAEIALYTNLLD